MSIQPLSLLVRILVSALVGIALLSGGVLAHPPSDVVVTYDQNSGDLIVAISHNVDDPTTHYVKKVTVTQGGTVLIEKSYTSQPDKVSFTYHYSLPQLDRNKGDVMVNAQCNMVGSRSEPSLWVRRLVPVLRKKLFQQHWQRQNPLLIHVSCLWRSVLLPGGS